MGSNLPCTGTAEDRIPGSFSNLHCSSSKIDSSDKRQEDKSSHKKKFGVEQRNKEQIGICAIFPSLLDSSADIPEVAG